MTKKNKLKKQAKDYKRKKSEMLKQQAAKDINEGKVKIVKIKEQS